MNNMTRVERVMIAVLYTIIISLFVFVIAYGSVQIIARQECIAFGYDTGKIVASPRLQIECISSYQTPLREWRHEETL